MATSTASNQWPPVNSRSPSKQQEASPITSRQQQATPRQVAENSNNTQQQSAANTIKQLRLKLFSLLITVKQLTLKLKKVQIELDGVEKEKNDVFEKSRQS